MHAWTDGYEISEVNKSKTKKKNRKNRLPAQGLEPWTTSFRYAKPENAIGSANSPLRSDLFFRTRYSSGNLIY